MSVKLQKKTAAKIAELVEIAPLMEWVPVPIALNPGKTFPVMNDELGQARVNKIVADMIENLSPEGVDIFWKVKALWSDNLVGEIKTADMIKTADGKMLVYVVIV